jgi:hypothetical protein
MQTTLLPLIFFILSLSSEYSGGDASAHLTNSIGVMRMPIKSGTFNMGQDGPPLEDDLRQKRFGEMYKDIDRIDFDEKPAHKVTITQSFLLGVTEVTVGQFRQFDPKFKIDDPKLQRADDDAASGVTWERGVAFCEWPSKKEGKTYRLPIEAEWEYACRAGTETLLADFLYSIGVVSSDTGRELYGGHQRIAIEANEFAQSPGADLEVHATMNVIMRGNRFTGPHQTRAGMPRSAKWAPP